MPRISGSGGGGAARTLARTAFFFAGTATVGAAAGSATAGAGAAAAGCCSATGAAGSATDGAGSARAASFCGAGEAAGACCATGVASGTAGAGAAGAASSSSSQSLSFRTRRAALPVACTLPDLLAATWAPARFKSSDRAVCLAPRAPACSLASRRGPAKPTALIFRRNRAAAAAEAVPALTASGSAPSRRGWGGRAPRDFGFTFLGLAPNLAIAVEIPGGRVRVAPPRWRLAGHSSPSDTAAFPSPYRPVEDPSAHTDRQHSPRSSVQSTLEKADHMAKNNTSTSTQGSTISISSIETVPQIRPWGIEKFGNAFWEMVRRGESPFLSCGAATPGRSFGGSLSLVGCLSLTRVLRRPQSLDSKSS